MIAEGERGHEQDEVADGLVRLGLLLRFGLVELEEELGEEDVALAGAEVLEEGGGVLGSNSMGNILA